MKREIWPIAKLHHDPMGYKSICVLTDGVDARAEYEYWTEKEKRVGRVKFQNVNNVRVMRFEAHAHLAPDESNVIYGYYRNGSRGFVIWFYEDIILDIEGTEYEIESWKQGTIPDNFDEWSVANPV
jgi:hypothetical protein